MNIWASGNPGKEQKKVISAHWYMQEKKATPMNIWASVSDDLLCCRKSVPTTKPMKMVWKLQEGEGGGRAQGRGGQGEGAGAGRDEGGRRGGAGRVRAQGRGGRAAAVGGAALPHRATCSEAKQAPEAWVLVLALPSRLLCSLLQCHQQPRLPCSAHVSQYGGRQGLLSWLEPCSSIAGQGLTHTRMM